MTWGAHGVRCRPRRSAPAESADGTRHDPCARAASRGRRVRWRWRPRPGAHPPLAASGGGGGVPSSPGWPASRSRSTVGAAAVRGRLPTARPPRPGPLPRGGPPTLRPTPAASPTATRATPARRGPHPAAAEPGPTPSSPPRRGCGRHHGDRADHPGHERPRAPPAAPHHVRAHARTGGRGARRRHRTPGSQPSWSPRRCPIRRRRSVGRHPLKQADPATIRASVPCVASDAAHAFGNATLAQQMWSSRQLFEVVVDSGPTTSTCRHRGPGAGTSAAYHRDVIRAHAGLVRRHVVAAGATRRCSGT